MNVLFQSNWLKCLGLALAWSLLQWLAFFPADQGWLIWIALVPLLALARCRASAWARYVSAWLAGLAFYSAAVSWMRVADDTMFFAWLAMSLYCSIYAPATVWALRRLDRRVGLPLTLSAPVVWTALEFARGKLMGGFPWYFVGHAQHNSAWLIQVADVTGALGLTAIVAAVNGLIAGRLLDRSRAVRRQAAVVACVIMAACGYGAWRSAQADFADGPRVALLQGSSTQAERNEAYARGIRQADELFLKEYTDLADQAAAGAPDLVVWPETSLPGELAFAAPGVAPSEVGPESRWIKDTTGYIYRATRHGDGATLLGVNCRVFGPGREFSRFNSALLVDREGAAQARFDKIHTVPFGEYVPLKAYFPWLVKFTPYEGMEYSVESGAAMPRMTVTSAGRQFTFGPLICYEDSDASLAREWLKEPKVDFFVNISNDGWFCGTAEHEQHFAVCRFRAVECRRAVVRAVNMGISGVIDGNGRVKVLPAATWKDSKACRAVVAATVPIDDRDSFYAWSGDWLPWTCWALLLTGLFVRRREV